MKNPGACGCGIRPFFARFQAARRKGQWNEFEREAKKGLKPDNDMNTNELSDRKLKLLSALAGLVIGWLCWNGGALGHAQPAPANQSPQLQEVVKLTQAKMGDDVILAYIKNSGASYNLSADDILYLNTQGVSQPVISALLQARSSAAPAPVTTPATPAPPVSPAPVSTYPAPASPPVSPYPAQVSPYPAPVSPYPAPLPSVPPPASEINLSYFQAQLAPYGRWVDIPGQGPCWVPSVQATVADWRPYFNEGHWVYTDDGWSWQSDYPWGEYTFHYGRWLRDPLLGWAWVPGYNWGPAWVCWRHAEGEGFCGWAPLPPGADFQVGIGFMWHGRLAVDADFGLGPDAFVFIPFDHFWARDYLAFRAPFGRVSFLFRASILANHYSFAGGRFVFDGIGRERIGLLTHHDVRAERIEFHDAHIAHAREVEHARGADIHGGGMDRSRSGGGHDEGSRSKDKDHGF
jgi:hypothetical protein